MREVDGPGRGVDSLGLSNASDEWYRGGLNNFRREVRCLRRGSSRSLGMTILWLAPSLHMSALMQFFPNARAAGND